MDIVQRARIFSIAAHEAVGQKRKYTGEPYYHHPADVAMTVYSVYGTNEMVAAAYLHDCVEDTNVSHLVIEREFGPVVAEYVSGLTDISMPQDGNRSVRKAIDRAHTAMQSPACKTIKLADLISNSKSICEHDKDFAKVYIKEKELLLEVLKEGDQTLWNQANEIVQKAKIKLGIE